MSEIRFNGSYWADGGIVSTADDLNQLCMTMDIINLNFTEQVKQPKSFLKFKGVPDRYTLKISALLILSALAFPVSAQESTLQNRWALETSLTFAPAAQIYMLKASYQLSGKSELGFGPAFQNWKNTDKTPMGQANAYTLLLSYRYFFYKNFHVELEFWPAYNHFDSFVDGKTYKGLELWVEYKVGYKVGITNNLYINLQPGLAHGLWMQNKWPEFKEYSTMDFIKKEIVFVPQILVGWSF